MPADGDGEYPVECRGYALLASPVITRTSHEDGPLYTS